MSYCTPEQIEEKKRQAVARLKANHNKTIQNGFVKNQSPSTSMFSTHNSFENNIYSSNSCKSNIINSINNTSKNSFTKFSNNKGSLYSNTTNSKSNIKPYNRNQFNSNQNNNPTSKVTSFYGANNIVTGSMHLISEDRFAIEQSKFHQQLIETFKTESSRQYDPKTKLWNFHINDYDSLWKKLLLLRPNVVIGPIPSWVLQCVRSKKTDYNMIDLSPIDPVLLNTLMPFQREGVCFGIEKKGRCLIADEMGLGKTFQALAIANYYKNDWPLLIATTSSMKNTWEEKIQEYIPSVPLSQIQYMQSGKDFIDDAKILITSHDLMAKCVDKLLEKRFGVIIVDESHILKNFKAKCTKAAITLVKQAKRIILLSGTPALSRPSELFTQISMLDPNFFPDFKEYSIRYCQGHMTHFGWNANGQSNLSELEILLSKKFMIRRTKDDVLKMLPNKTREIVKLSPELLELSEMDLKYLGLLTNDYTSKKSNEKHAALLTFFSESAKLKTKAVRTYISQILEENLKFIVFAHHQIMINSICDLLDSKKVFYVKIDGKTNSDQRKFFVDKFQLQDKYKCAVLSITAANAGITLTAAQLVLFAEIHWNPSILSQAESRAHRIGQENQVQVRYLLADGTVDDYMWEMIKSKQDVLNEAGLSKGSFKDTDVTEQITITNDLVSNKRIIENYFVKINNTVSENNCDVQSTDNVSEIPNSDANLCDTFNGFDDTLNLEEFNNTNFEDDFFDDDDDDAFANVDIDVFN